MPRQILFVQGAGEATHDTWDDRLVRSLEHALGTGYTVLYPRMPDPAEPRYPTWRAALMAAFDTLEDGAILVGHSVGGTILLHLLSERCAKLRPGAIALIAAPFIGEGGWPGDDTMPRRDFAERIPEAIPLFLYHGTADDVVPFAHLGLYARAIPHAIVRALQHRDHQLNDDLREVARDILETTGTHPAQPINAA